jgi:hypothetical protein
MTTAFALLGRHGDEIAPADGGSREAYDGASLRTIAADLMADGITTGSGSATWHAAQVRRVLDGTVGVAVTERLDRTA